MCFVYSWRFFIFFLTQNTHTPPFVSGTLHFSSFLTAWCLGTKHFNRSTKILSLHKIILIIVNFFFFCSVQIYVFVACKPLFCFFKIAVNAGKCLASLAQEYFVTALVITNKLLKCNLMSWTFVGFTQVKSLDTLQQNLVRRKSIFY